VEQLSGDSPLFFIPSVNFAPGVVGLVAGKLTERYYRPAVVVEQGESESRGSARSIHEFDIGLALDELRSMLVRHGGHSRAAGFTVRTESLPAFADALRSIARRDLAAHSDLRPTLNIDSAVQLEQLSWGLLEQFARLEPTGQENPPPLLLAQNVRLREVRTVGDDKHLKLMVDQDAGSPVFDAILFGQGERRSQLTSGMRLDLVFQLGANEWNSRRVLQLNVQDMRSSQ
jgi:single-stranded-DNA-specific exonuclease